MSMSQKFFFKVLLRMNGSDIKHLRGDLGRHVLRRDNQPVNMQTLAAPWEWDNEDQELDWKYDKQMLTIDITVNNDFIICLDM